MVLYYKSKQCIVFSLFSFLIGCMLTSFFMKIDDNGSTKSQSSSMFGDVPQDSASPVTSSQNHLLIVLVLSSPGNAERRNIVRDTWFTFCVQNPDILCYFVLGNDDGKTQSQHILIEQKKHRDLLILSDVIDSYHSLSEKVLASFKWVDKNIQNYQYLLKCDDDSFVDIEGLSVELRTRFKGDEGRNLHWGFFDGRAHVKRHGKWQESKWNLCDRYLPYALGGGYILSKHLITYIAKNAEDLILFNSEDVSVGVWLAPLKVNRHHDCRFDTEATSRGCSNRYLVTHKQPPEAMRKMYSSMQRTGKICETEYQLKPGYNYNWSAPPSQCCARVSDNPDIF